MGIQVGKGKIFQICVLVANLPVSTAGIAPVTNPDMLPYTQRGTSSCQQNPGGY